MAESAGFVVVHLVGDLSFARGGMDADFLVGAFVKSIAEDGTVVLQRADGSEHTFRLAGGTGLADGAVTEPKLATGAVSTRALADDAVIGRKLAGDSVASGHLVDFAVISVKIASDQILSRHIAADQVTQGELAGNSVGTSELIDGQVTEVKLASAVRTKLNALTPARPIIQVSPNFVTDEMAATGGRFIMAAHVPVERLPPAATHFRAFVGRAKGDPLAISAFSAANVPQQAELVRADVEVSASDLDNEYGSAVAAISTSNFIEAGVEYLDRDGALAGRHNIQLAVPQRAPLVQRWRGLDGLPRTVPGGGVAQLTVFPRRGKLVDILAERSFRVDPQDAQAFDGQEMLLRVTQDGTGGRTIDFHSDVRTLPGIPARSLNSGPNEITFLRLVRIGSHWYYAGRAYQ